MQVFNMNRMLALSVLLTVSSAITAPKSRTLKVFLLAGQSNMEGYGKVEMGRNTAWTKGAMSRAMVKLLSQGTAGTTSMSKIDWFDE